MTDDEYLPDDAELRKQYKWDKTNCFSSVTEFDLESLRDPHGYVTGPIVDEMLKYELEKAKNKKNPPKWANQTLIVSHNFWDSIENAAVSDPERPPRYNADNEFHGHRKEPWFYRRILIPCYINHNHWVLVNWELPRKVYDLTTGPLKICRKGHPEKKKKYIKWETHVKIYDSIHGKYGRVWRQIAWWFADGAMKMKRWFAAGAPQIPGIFAPRDREPTQRDGNNCGFYVIHMAKSIIFGLNPKEKYHVPHDDPETFRAVKKLIAQKRQHKYMRMAF
jgi:hypothetical protein